MTKAINESKCKHSYKELETDIQRIYTDDEPYRIKVHSIVYCKRCLEIKLISKELGNFN